MSHIVVLQNGLFGYHGVFNNLSEHITREVPNARVLISNVNNFLLTHQGIEACGKRLADTSS